MAIYRFSAVEMMGVPIDQGEPMPITEAECLRAFGRYSIVPTVVEPMKPTDITPYFWDPTKHPFRFILSSEKAGEVVIEMRPTAETSGILSAVKMGSLVVAAAEDGRTIRLPQDQESMAIAGYDSPRFPGMCCLYEAFVYL